MATGIQSSVIVYIGGANQTGYSRKIAVLDLYPGNGVYVAAIQRAASAGLFTNVLVATSASAKQSALYDGLQKIAASTVDDPELDQSPAAQLNLLKKALSQYAAAPDNVTLAQAAVASAKDMATSSTRRPRRCSRPARAPTPTSRPRSPTSTSSSPSSMRSTPRS
jgi:flagellar hook-associated protein 1 FlgK